MPRNRRKICKFRNSAFAQQAGRCHYCDQPMWLSDPGEYSAKYGLTIREAARFQRTAEHLLARKDGGGDESKNIVAACRFCNHGRHARAKPLSPERYQALVRRRLKARRWHGARLLSRLGDRLA